MIRKFTAMLSLLLLLGIVPVFPVQAAQPEAKESVQQLISYYRYYQQDAEGDIQRILEEMGEADPEEAARWSAIMDGWRWINEEMPVETGVLPDDLPADDSLCIVVLGFKLESTGAMNPELLHRLEVALESAGKYPNAILVCTGGATSQRSDITEASEMKKWLVSAGVEENRIFVETKAASTPQNAIFVYELLQRNCPQVKNIAIITSDYHIYRSMAVFFAEAKLKDLHYDISGNAVCTTERAGEHELEKQANNLAELASVRLTEVPKPELQVTEPELTEQTERLETIPEETDPPQTTQAAVVAQPQELPVEHMPETEQKTESRQIPVFAVAVFAGALLLALILLLVLIWVIRPKRK